MEIHHSKYECKDEKADPDLLNSSRIKRIARGSGWPEHEVKELLKNYKNSKNMMKASKGTTNARHAS